MNHKKDFIKLGNEINWYPKHMHTRYNEWVENIMWDWCISRQRYFGVPFPVWYCKNCKKTILANIQDLLELKSYIGKKVRISFEYKSTVPGVVQLFYTTDLGEDYTGSKVLNANVDLSGTAFSLRASDAVYLP